MGRKARQGPKKSGIVRPMGSGTSEGVQHQTKSATTISEPGTKGSRRR